MRNAVAYLHCLLPLTANSAGMAQSFSPLNNQRRLISEGCFWGFTEDVIHGLGKFGGTVGSQGLLTPADVCIGSDQDAAALAYLSQARPVVVDVKHLAIRANDEASDLHTNSRRDLFGRDLPGLATDTGEEGKAALAGQIERAHCLARVLQPAMGQACARPGRGVIAEFFIACIGRLGRAIRDHDRRVVALIELNPMGTRLQF